MELGRGFALLFCMNRTIIRNIVYLKMSQNVPSYLSRIRGANWNFVKSKSELFQSLQLSETPLLVLLHVETLTPRILEVFVKAGVSKPLLSFMFIVQAIDNTIYSSNLDTERYFFVFESEGSWIGELVTRRLMGFLVKSRKQQRINVKSQVMIKKSVILQASPTGEALQVLREGEMVDFSEGGARITVPASGLKVQDFVSLMYKDQLGRWVAVESQVRWVVSGIAGNQTLGVQFLAVSA